MTLGHFMITLLGNPPAARQAVDRIEPGMITMNTSRCMAYGRE